LLTPASSLNDVDSAQQIVAIYPQHLAELNQNQHSTAKLVTRRLGDKPFGRQHINLSQQQT